MVADGFALQIILNFQLTHSLTHSFTFEQWTFFFVPTDQFSSHFENTFAIETNKNSMSSGDVLLLSNIV